MTETTDPTFYRTPGDAIATAPEALAYVAAYDPRGVARGAIAVLDCDPAFPVYGKVVGWADMPTGSNELHHFGWNACSSALCHGGHAGQLERRVSRRAGPALVADLHPRYQTRTALIMLYATRYKDMSCPSHVPGQPTANTATGTGSSGNEPGSSLLPGRPVAESAAPAGHGGAPRGDVRVLHRHSSAVTAWSGRQADVRAFGSWPKSPVAAAVPCAHVARPGRSGPCTEFRATHPEGTR